MKISLDKTMIIRDIQKDTSNRSKCNKALRMFEL